METACVVPSLPPEQSPTYAFLRQFLAKDGLPPNLTSFKGGAAAKWFVPYSHQEQFFRLYEQDRKANYCFYFVQQARDVHPLFFDLDSNKDPQTTEQPEYGFLQCYKHVANVLCGQCGLAPEYVLERAHVSRRQGNLHIVYEGLDVTYSQHNELRRQLLHLLKEDDPDTKWDEIVDSPRSLRMLGSLKFRQRASPGKPRGAMIAEGFYAPCEKPSHTSNSFDLLDAPIDVEELLATSLWRPAGIPCHPSIPDEDEVAITAVVRERSRHHPSTAAGDVAKLCDLVNWPARAGDYNGWITVLTIFKEEGHAQGDPDMYKELAMDVSQKAGTFVPGDERKWDSVPCGTSGPRLTLGTLRHWARADNRDGYETWKRGLSEDRAVNLLWNKQDIGLARIAETQLVDTIKLTGRKQHDFIVFDEEATLWRDAGISTVKRRINVVLDRELQLLRGKFADELARAPDGDDKEAQQVRGMCQKRVDQVEERLTYVNRNTGLNAIVALCLESFTAEDGFLSKLDGVPHLLGVKNGVVDLRTGELRDRRPEDMVYNVVNTMYDPEADCSWWNEQVSRMMAHNAEHTRFLQTLLGYGITGEVKEHIFAFFIGAGRNGKSVCLDVMHNLLGDRMVFPGHKALIFADEPVCNIDDQRASLSGVRTLMWSESSKDRAIDIASMQMLSGGDTFNAKPNHGRALTVTPRFLPVLATNWLPRLPQIKQSTIDRPVVIQFPVYFRNMLPHEEETQFEKRVDRDLVDRAMEGDGGAVLKWLVQGAVHYYTHPGFLHENVPEQFREIKSKWLEEQDRLGTFIRDLCIVGRGLAVRTTRFNRIFNQHQPSAASEHGGSLGREMHERGFETVSTRPTADKSRTQSCYKGLAMKEDVPDEHGEMPRSINSLFLDD